MYVIPFTHPGEPAGHGAGVSRHTPEPGFFVAKDDDVPIGVILPSPVRSAMMPFAAANPTMLPLTFAGPAGITLIAAV
jgi:hypothetical protein